MFYGIPKISMKKLGKQLLWQSINFFGSKMTFSPCIIYQSGKKIRHPMKHQRKQANIVVYNLQKENFLLLLCVFLTKYISHLNRIKSIYCYTFYEHRYKIFIEKASRMFFVIQTNRSLTKRKFCAFIMYVCIKRISKFNSTASVFK